MTRTELEAIIKLDLRLAESDTTFDTVLASLYDTAATIIKSMLDDECAVVVDDLLDSRVADLIKMYTRTNFGYSTKDQPYQIPPSFDLVINQLRNSDLTLLIP